MHDKEVIKQAISWVNDGFQVALATVVSTWGSSPRPVGSHLVVNHTGAFAGSLSGGCVEPFVVSEAIDLMEEGGVREVEYGVTNAQAAEVRLSCGGDIRIFIEPCPSVGVLRKMIDELPLTRVVDLQDGKSIVVTTAGFAGALDMGQRVLGEAQHLYKQGASGIVVRNALATDFSIIVDATHARYARVLLHRAAGEEGLL